MSEIQTKYQAIQSWAGSPMHDEATTPDGVARYQTFKRGDGMFTSIHSHPQCGTHETHGGIRGMWEKMGWEHSYLGYPLSDEDDFVFEGRVLGRYNLFQGGIIIWYREKNTRVVIKYTPHGPAIDVAEKSLFESAMEILGAANEVIEALTPSMRLVSKLIEFK